MRKEEIKKELRNIKKQANKYFDKLEQLAEKEAHLKAELAKVENKPFQLSLF